MEKACHKCRRTYLNADEGFTKAKGTKDGYRSTCKECSKDAKKRWYEDNKPITYERSRAWKKNNKEKAKESARKTEQRPEARAKKNIVNAKYKKKNPDRIRANDKLKRAVKKGAVIKPANCEICDAERPKEKMQGHHEDYNKPLLVIWMCGECHSNYHSGKSERADEIRRKVKKLYRKLIMKEINMKIIKGGKIV